VVNAPSTTGGEALESATAYVAYKLVIELLIVVRLALATVLAADDCDLLSSAVADAVTNAFHVLSGVDNAVVSEALEPELPVLVSSLVIMTLIGSLG
jgi:hypothetical protein